MPAGVLRRVNPGLRLRIDVSVVSGSLRISKVSESTSTSVKGGGNTVKATKAEKKLVSSSYQWRLYSTTFESTWVTADCTNDGRTCATLSGRHKIEMKVSTSM